MQKLIQAECDRGLAEIEKNRRTATTKLKVIGQVRLCRFLTDLLKELLAETPRQAQRLAALCEKHDLLTPAPSMFPARSGHCLR